MTLPVSPNQIKLSQIKAEFNSSANNLRAYYAGGGIVLPGTVGYPNGGSTAVPIPTSGAISLKNFYGATASAPSTLVPFLTSVASYQIPVGVSRITFLVVAGGGGGGSSYPDGQQWVDAGAGGGGAGGGIYQTNYAVTAGQYLRVTIGAGGAGGPGGVGSYGGVGSKGTNTVVSLSTDNVTFTPIFTAIGGGRGATYSDGNNQPQQSGGDGGSGGGANASWYGDHPPGMHGGFGTVGQGHDGALGQRGSHPTAGGGGGGGYAAIPPSANNTIGGAGTVITLLGTPVSFGGGGGGGTDGAPGSGGSNGGGNGGQQASNGSNGVANTGGGGGGGGRPLQYVEDPPPEATLVMPNGGNGGSGVVYMLLNP